MTQSKTIGQFLSSIPPENTATRAAFFLAGFIMAVWASMVPFVKLNLSLDEAHLGALLLCVGLGALVVMPFCGGIVAKRGARFLLRQALFAIPVILFAINFSTNTILTACLLFLFGMIFGSVDVSMNVHAVEVDRRSEKRLIAGFHALYSLGSVVGALAMAGLLNVGVELLIAVGALLVVCLLIWLFASPKLLSDAGKAQGPTKSFVIPRGFVLWLGLICLLLFMIEGAVLDWAACFWMKRKRQQSKTQALPLRLFQPQ